MRRVSGHKPLHDFGPSLTLLSRHERHLVAETISYLARLVSVGPRDPEENVLEQPQDAGARLRAMRRERDDARRERERDAARAEVATLQIPNAVKLEQRSIPNMLKPCCAFNKSQDILELRLDSPMTDDITGKTIQIYINDISYVR